ncbi:MaoC/PaaZ C-terminal domain-containing protein [Pseudochelatococcus lubricantis]|uniref:MaoC family dehydratase n=1 Tax=Pseudochelatococcus lubricantis TaxID=1538102 RepID=UPI0035EA08FF
MSSPSSNAMLHERMFNAEALCDWRVREAQHTYREFDAAFYALSLGLGRHSLDPRALSLVDPWSPDFRPLPLFALICGYPGFWLGDETVRSQTGLDPERILHIEQALVLKAPLEPNATVIGRTTVNGIVDKGKGRASLLYSTREVIDARSQTVIAECRQVHYLLGAGGGGGTDYAPPPRHNCPSRPPEWQVDVPTHPEQALLYRLNGDANPLHIDPRVAQRSGFERPILHGLCTGGIAFCALLALKDFDVTQFTNIGFRMVSPVIPGDTLRVSCWSDGSFQATVPDRNQIVLDGGYAGLDRPAEKGESDGISA